MESVTLNTTAEVAATAEASRATVTQAVATGSLTPVQAAEANEQITLLAGKYKTADDLNKGIAEILKAFESKPVEAREALYKDLQTKLSTPATEKPAEQPKPTEAAKPTLTIPDKPAEPSTLPFDKYTAELASTGKLSDESYADLAKRGFPKEAVDSYVAGELAKAERYAATLLSKVEGGVEGWTAITTWATTNLPTETAKNYNELLANPKTAEAAVLALQALYTNAVGRPGHLVGGNSGAAGETSLFESNAEMVRAMSDPRYENDPAYRRSVESRVRRSIEAGRI